MVRLKKETCTCLSVAKKDTGAEVRGWAPRRLSLSTLKCYFEGRKELFKGLKIDTMEKDWKKYPVFHIDFNGYDFLNKDDLFKVIEGYITEYERVWGRYPYSEAIGDRFAYVLSQAHRQTGLPCVVLVDEYDKPLLDVLDTGAKVKDNSKEILLEDFNRDTLKAFYSVFKKADADLRFVMLTGVTKFSQVSVFSGFNQPNDISISREFEALCGITENELSEVFASTRSPAVFRPRQGLSVISRLSQIDTNFLKHNQGSP